MQQHSFLCRFPMKNFTWMAFFSAFGHFSQGSDNRQDLLGYKLFFISKLVATIASMLKVTVVAAFVGIAAGFQPVAPMVHRATALSMASSMAPNKRAAPLDDWSNKPLYERKSTTPVAVRNVSKRERERIPDVMIDPNYFLTWGVLLLGPLIWWYHPCKFVKSGHFCYLRSIFRSPYDTILLSPTYKTAYELDGSPSLIGIFGGGFHVLFSALLWVQTRRVRCVFEKDGFEFYNIKGPKLDLEKGAWLQEKPSNYVSGTRNRWTYDSIINYGFFPSLEFPVICYFKETETPKVRRPLSIS